MTPRDLRVLCAALGFSAVVMQDGKLPKQDWARRASEFAGISRSIAGPPYRRPLNKERKRRCKLSI